MPRRTIRWKMAWLATQGYCFERGQRHGSRAWYWRITVRREPEPLVNEGFATKWEVKGWVNLLFGRELNNRLIRAMHEALIETTQGKEPVLFFHNYAEKR